MRKKSLKETDNNSQTYNGNRRQEAVEGKNVREGRVLERAEQAAASADPAIAPRMQGAPPAIADSTVYNTIVENVRLGLDVSSAASAAGVNPKLIYDWIRRGEQNINELYAQFVQDLYKAAAEYEASHLQNITQHSSHDWRASAWILERRYPHKWGSKSKLEVEHKDQESEEVKEVLNEAASDPEARNHLRKAMTAVFTAHQDGQGNYSVDN